MQDTSEWLEAFYSGECDGDWEHSYGIRISTVDNPGWRVRIDLTGTVLESQLFPKVETHNSDQDWMICWVQDRVFEAAGGPRNLKQILLTFRRWHEQTTQDHQTA